MSGCTCWVECTNLGITTPCRTDCACTIAPSPMPVVQASEPTAESETTADPDGGSATTSNGVCTRKSEGLYCAFNCEETIACPTSAPTTSPPTLAPTASPTTWAHANEGTIVGYNLFGVITVLVLVAALCVRFLTLKKSTRDASAGGDVEMAEMQPTAVKTAEMHPAAIYNRVKLHFEAALDPKGDEEELSPLERQLENERKPSLIPGLPNSFLYLELVMIFHASLSVFILGPMFSGPGSSGGLTVLLGLGPWLHVAILPYFMYRKQNRTKIADEQNSVAETVEFEEGGKTILFAIKYTLCEKIFMAVCGFFMNIIENIVWLLAQFGLDLSAYVIWAPFWNFWKVRKLLHNYRINGAKLKFSAEQADAYHEFLWQSMLNFFTFSLYSNLYAKLMGLTYERWLDEYIVWRAGSPPLGFTNEFKIFSVKLKFIDQVVLFVVGYLYAPLMYIPFASIPLDIFSKRVYYDMIVSNYVIGGVNPIFGPAWTFSNHLNACLESMLWSCGCCAGKEFVYIDSHVIIGVCLFDVGTQVEARIAWEKKKGLCGKKWVPGTVTFAHPDLTYDITYETGEKEERVPAGCVRFLSWPSDKTETYAAQKRANGTAAPPNAGPAQASAPQKLTFTKVVPMMKIDPAEEAPIAEVPVPSPTEEAPV